MTEQKSVAERIAERNTKYVLDVTAWEAEHGPRRLLTCSHNPYSLQKIYDDYNADMYELLTEGQAVRSPVAPSLD